MEFERIVAYRNPDGSRIVIEVREGNAADINWKTLDVLLVYPTKESLLCTVHLNEKDKELFVWAFVDEDDEPVYERFINLGGEDYGKKCKAKN